MKILHISIILLILTSCSNLIAPKAISPTIDPNLRSVGYGDSPNNYQKVLKDYLISNLTNYKSAKVEFINEPEKLSIEHLGDYYSGYRVCLSINEKKGDYYKGYRNHFFIIKNGKVTLHLFDSGLLKIPFEYCVTRDADKELFIDDIPDEREEITIESMDDIKIKKDRAVQDDKLQKDPKLVVDQNTYILCNFNQNESTFVFNENKKSFQKIKGTEKIIYDVTFNEAYIVANIIDMELTINRVSGKASLESKQKSDIGKCMLLDRTKF